MLLPLSIIPPIFISDNTANFTIDVVSKFTYNAASTFPIDAAAKFNIDVAKFTSATHVAARFTFDATSNLTKPLMLLLISV